MTKCPYCREQIPDDSWFCDQCGKELKWCPECRAPKRGTECPACGETLLDAGKYFSLGKPAGQKAPAAPAPQTAPDITARLDNVMNDMFSDGGFGKAATAAAGQASVPCLEGNGWKLTFKEGQFGRSGGIWLELASIAYVSGRHGQMRKNGNNWEISDSGSTNGTYVNGSKLVPGTWVALKKGDQVKIATVKFNVN